MLAAIGAEMPARALRMAVLPSERAPQGSGPRGIASTPSSASLSGRTGAVLAARPGDSWVPALAFHAALPHDRRVPRLVTVIETETFARRADKLLTPKERDELVAFLAANPTAGDRAGRGWSTTSCPRTVRSTRCCSTPRASRPT